MKLLLHQHDTFWYPGIILLAAMLLFLASCHTFEEPADVLLISIDTLRSDHLGAYGYPEGYTPFLDRLARTGTLFRNVISAIPQTTPSHATLLTGLYPHHHGSRDNAIAIRNDVETIPEMLKNAGYSTAGFAAHFLLAPERSGLHRGFTEYKYVDHQKKHDTHRKKGPFPLITNEYLPADQVNKNVLTWIETTVAPFFLFVHYYDCHKPYQPQKPFNQMTDLSLYDRELASVDSAIVTVFSALSARGFTKNLIVHMLADHGESLGEHNYTGHGKYLYYPSMEIPWIFRDFKDPGQGRIITEMVGNVDLVPTLLARLNLPTPVKSDGRNVLNPSDSDTLYAFSESGSNWKAEPKKRIYSVRDGNNTLIAGLNSGDRELYDRGLDPGETVNRHDFQSQDTLRMEKQLQEWLMQDHGTVPDPAEILDADTIRALQALGYMQEDEQGS